MSYQFFHIEAYSLVAKSYEREITIKKGAKAGEKKTKKTETRSLKEIMEEQARIDEACPHVDDPRRPGLLYGVPPMEVLPLAEEWADQAKDSRGYKMKSDGNVALVGVASLPREMEDDFPEFAEVTLKFLKEKYGDRLKSVVVHDDEPHPHLHFTVIPRKGERFDDIHEGLKAKNEAKKNNQKGKAQNLAYVGAMQKLQDEFHNKVGIKTGLTRIGPGRRRLTRDAWQAEQKQAKAFANAKAVAASGYRAGIKKAKTEATEIVAQAQEKAKGLGVKMAGWFSGLAGGWHEPSAKAKAEATKVKAEAQKAQEEAQKAQEEAEKVKAKAKKEADQRVANVANQLTEERTKTKDLAEELRKAQEQANDLAKRLALYEDPTKGTDHNSGGKFKK